MARKNYSRYRRYHSNRRRKGKGTSYIDTRGKLRLLVVLLIAGVIFYILRLFVLLFTNKAAISGFGWLVISLLTILIMGMFGMKVYELHRYLKDKTAYEASIYYAQTGIPFKKMKVSKGKMFEYQMSRALKVAFPSAPQLNDLTFKRIDSVNEYAQIDCILFHETGIYVLELKDYKGYVYGGKKNRLWNVGYERDGMKATYEFQNPIMQNEKHIEDLQKLKSARYYNIVMFSSNTTLDSDLRELHTLDSLKAFINSKEAIYDAYELKDILAKIKHGRRTEKTEDHIKRIQFNRAKYK